jgi:hypothetical protein
MPSQSPNSARNMLPAWPAKLISYVCGRIKVSWQDATAGRGAPPRARFAHAEFRPTLPATLVTWSVLHDRLTAGVGRRLTVVWVRPMQARSVLLSSSAAGPLSCRAAQRAARRGLLPRPFCCGAAPPRATLR